MPKINIGIDNMFDFIEFMKSNFKKYIIPLVTPHIGHGIWVIFLNIQNGLNNKIISRRIIPLIIKVFIIFLFT